MLKINAIFQLLFSAQTGTLFVLGTLLFSGTCYYRAIQKSKGREGKLTPTNLAPMGGICLILGWLSLLL